MPPLRLICTDMIRSFIKPVSSPAKDESTSKNDDTSDNPSNHIWERGIFGIDTKDDNNDNDKTDHDSDDEVYKKKLKIRKSILTKTDELHKVRSTNTQPLNNNDLEERLRKIASLEIDF